MVQPNPSRHSILFPIALACLLSVEGRARNLAQDGIEGPAQPTVNHSAAGSGSSATALFVPVILKAAGRNDSFFTSELTLTNRDSRPARLQYTYTAHAGGGSGTAAETLAAGRQTIVTDAIEHLRNLGIPIPASGNRIGTLRVEVGGAVQVGVSVRTTTLAPDGRAGLAYPGIAASAGFEEAVYVCGLRQNEQDRSNLAIQHLGSAAEGPIALRVTVYSGEAERSDGQVVEERMLSAGGFYQYNGILTLAGIENGYVKVERVEGRAPFYAFGVINDNFNSDGSFVFPVAPGSLSGARGQTLPVLVETREFSSELTVTNFSEEARRLRFRFVAAGLGTPDGAARFSLEIGAGEQRIIPDVIEAELRRKGVEGVRSSRGGLAGALLASVAGGDMSGIVIGARTSASDGRGGRYGVSYNAAPDGGALTGSAWVDGLQQNGENRSNLALVNTGEVDGGDSLFTLEIYDGETGRLANTVSGLRVAAGGWRQINGILGNYAPGVRQGYLRIRKLYGNNPYLAYGVINDGGAPGERSGDGAWVTAAAATREGAGGPMTDREVLEVLYHVTGGPEWKRADNWLSDRPLEEWYGVNTDENGRVTELNFRFGRGLTDETSNGLSGPIPPALGNLSNLQTLNLARNQLSGRIPPELGNLASLQHLFLSYNELSGRIPPELGNLANLQVLSLAENQLSGRTPSELGNLANLVALYLGGTRLTGAIPRELQRLKKLGALDMKETDVCVPADAALQAWLDTFGYYRSSGLVCDGTRRVLFSASSYEVIEGESVTVSVRLIDQSEEPLQTVGVALTAAGGSATASDYAGVPERVSLTAPATEAEFVFTALEDDRFDPGEAVVLGLGWPLPAGVTAGDPETAMVRIIDPGTAARTDREVLEAVYYATGGPEWIDRTHWLSDLPLAQWRGVDADENGRVTGLELYDNGLSGPIPPALGKLANLQRLDLWDNQLSGSIPPELGKLANLQTLRLAINQLTGPIPPALGKLANLQWLELSSNRLSGSIPPELGKLASLQGLYLFDNQLSGPIPPGLGKLTNLQSLELSSNRLSGSIPSELGKLANLQSLALFDNQLSGPIPPELGKLANLQRLDLWDNQLTGSIPPELGKLANLQTLRLAINQLTGPIPPGLGKLANLQSLELNGNRLTGSIPPELGGLANLQTLHLAYNPDLTADDASWLQELPLERLNLAATQVCVPEDAAFQKRLETIEFTPSGLACGRPVPAMSSIDVAVFYTTGARDKAGGASAVEAEVDLMVAETNRAYEDSGASQRIILVAREELEYTESGSGFTDLERLGDPSDGYMDQVQVVRDREGADLVHLISQITDVGGVADLSGAFGVTGAWYGTWVFAHELGHNMGLSHDRYAEVGAPYGRSLLPYSYGYVNQQAFVAGAPQSARWRTIMSYPDQCGDAGLHCERLLRFSNPTQTWLGDPLGVLGEERTEAVDGPVDAARALNATRHSVAALRPRSMASRLSMSSPLSQRRPEAGSAVGPLPLPAGDLFRAAAPSVRVRGVALHAGRSPGGGAALRRRDVGVDLAMLARVSAGGSGALRLNLFNDVVVTGIIDRRTPTFSGGYALSGRLLGVPGGTVTLVVNGSVVAGTVRGPGALYRIRPGGGGRHAILQIDPSRSSWTCGTGQRPQ